MVFDGPDRPFREERFPLPKLQPGEALVEVKLATVCGSDLHSFEGRRSTPCPSILGHEILGQIAALPSDEEVRDVRGEPLRVGDRVTWSVAASCGDCFYCRKQIPQKCVKLFKYGHESTAGESPLSGGLAEYCHLVAGTAIVRVPDSLPDLVAVPANCATATAAAAMRCAGECSGSVVLIHGAGMLGLTAAAMADDAGASEVIVTDINVDRLDVAERFGATRTVPATDKTSELSRQVKELTDGRGADVVLEMSGSPDAVEQSISLMRIGGRLVLVGAVFPNRPVALNAETVVRKLISIQGVHNYTPSDLVVAVEFLDRAHGIYPFSELIDAVFPLNDAGAAFQHALRTGAFRVAVRPHEDQRSEDK